MIPDQAFKLVMEWATVGLAIIIALSTLASIITMAYWQVRKTWQRYEDAFLTKVPEHNSST